MSDDPFAIANKQLAKLSNLFVAPAKPPSFEKRPCLVCGRHTRFAFRIHPKCRAKVGTEEADRLVDAYFKRPGPTTITRSWEKGTEE